MKALRHPAGRAAAVFVGLVVVFNVVGLVLGGGDAGPPSSSYSTGPDGVAAYAELLSANGYELERLRASLGEAALDPSQTLLLLDGAPLETDAKEELERFVLEGGRLVIGGNGAEWASRLIDPAARRRTGGPVSSSPLVPVADTAGVDEVTSSGRASWSHPGGALPVLGDGADALVLVARPGDGELVLLADVSPLHNAHLDQTDNAQLGLNLAGDEAAPVTFVESVHGYSSTGIAAIPTRWKWALAGAIVAALGFMWARGRRLGPPEPAGRDLAPARRLYVESVAGILMRTRNPAWSMLSLQDRLRSRLAARGGLDASANEDDLRGAARAQGLDDDEIEALFAQASSEHDVLVLGRAAAKVTGDGAGKLHPVETKRKGLK